MTFSITYSFASQAELFAFVNAGATPPATPIKPGKAAAAAAAAATKPAAYVPRHTTAEMSAALAELKASKGTDAARAVIEKHGFKKMAEVTGDEKTDLVYDDAKAAMEVADEL